MFIIVRPDHGEHRFQDLRSRQPLNRYGEIAVNHIAVVLLAAALVVVLALLAAAAAGTLARLDGATYPAALMRAATTFAAAVTGALAQLLPRA
ncbi:hypothetical protein [Streptomyces sp. NPDC007205]|uniref:hypothetical protein n=1 Tax=Streptomyces sp. NPDC007205 TaxID=3154316 RepID=UPI0033D6BB9D